MNRPSMIHITGDLSGLAESFIRKALIDGMTISVPQSNHSRIAKIMREEILHSGANVIVHNQNEVIDANPVIFFDNFSQDQNIAVPSDNMGSNMFIVANSVTRHSSNLGNISCFIMVHDMIPITNSDYSNNHLLSEMLARLKLGGQYSSSNDVSDQYWWISENDVASGIYHLVLSRIKCTGLVNICGRRGWSVTDTFQQFSMLYHRTIAGTTGEFDVKHLTSSPIIPEGVVSVENASNSKRPDLSVIHGLITRSGGEGWRPLTPLRTSLMQYLAAHIE